MTKVSLIWFPCGHLDGLCRLYVESCNSVSSLRGQIWACFLFYLETWGPLSSLSGHPGVIIFFFWTPGICLDKLDVSTISTLSTQTPGSWSLSSLCGCGVINISTGTESLHSLCGRLGVNYHLYIITWESWSSMQTPGSHYHFYLDTWNLFLSLHGHLGVNHHLYIDTWVSWSYLYGPLGVIMVSMCTSGSHIVIYLDTWESLMALHSVIIFTPGSHFDVVLNVFLFRMCIL